MQELYLLRRAVLAAQMHHPNVLPLLGVVTEGVPRMFIFQACTRGSLAELVPRGWVLPQLEEDIGGSRDSKAPPPGDGTGAHGRDVGVTTVLSDGAPTTVDTAEESVEPGGPTAMGEPLDGVHAPARAGADQDCDAASVEGEDWTCTAATGDGDYDFDAASLDGDADASCSEQTDDMHDHRTSVHELETALGVHEHESAHPAEAVERHGNGSDLRDCHTEGEDGASNHGRTTLVHILCR